MVLTFLFVQVITSCNDENSSPYNELGRTDRFKSVAARNYNHGQLPDGAGRQLWFKRNSKNENWEYYTPLFIDMYDNHNQGNPASTIRPNDNVSGYSFQVLEQDVLRRTLGFSSLKTRLKQFKPIGVTDIQIDELVDFYSGL